MDEPRIDNIYLTPLLDTLRLQKISDQTYFSEAYSEYISNSRLGLLQKQGPKAFFEGFGAQTGYQSFFTQGSAVHQLVLQKEYFEMCMDVDLPPAKLGGMADYLYPYYLKGEINSENVLKASEKIDYYKGSMNSVKIEKVIQECTNYWINRKKYEESHNSGKEIFYLDPKMRDITMGCVNNLNNDTNVQNLLHPVDLLGNSCISENEQAILLDVEAKVDNYEPFIIRLKAKLDNYTIDTFANVFTVNDVKTSGRGINRFGDTIFDFNYNRELAIYGWLGSLCCQKFYGMHNPEIKGNFLVVSTIPNYETLVVPMKRKWFLDGFEQFKTLVKQVCYYKQYGYDSAA